MGIRFNIQVDPYWPKWQTQRSKLAAKNLENSQFHQVTWNCYPMLGFVLANIPQRAISHPELQHSDKALRDDLVLPSASTLSNIGRRDYTLTVAALKKQLPSPNKVSLGLDGWISTEKLAIMTIIAYYMDRNSASCEVQLTFDEDDCLFFSRFESQSTMTGQSPTWWSKASRTFDGCSWSFWAYRQRFAWK